MSCAFKYFAFISHSRKDSKAAVWLQKRLEWFRFPVKLVAEDRRPPHDRLQALHLRNDNWTRDMAAFVKEI